MGENCLAQLISPKVHINAEGSCIQADLPSQVQKGPNIGQSVVKESNFSGLFWDFLFGGHDFL